MPEESSGRMPIVVIGYGGHGKVVAAALSAGGWNVEAVNDQRLTDERVGILSYPLLSDAEVERTYPPSQCRLALGVGGAEPVNRGPARMRVAMNWAAKGYQFVRVLHPRAMVDPGAELAEGVQVHVGAIVQTGVSIGRWSIVNSGAIVEHDCRVGELCHVAPGAVLCGNVSIGDGAHVGAGAVVRQGISIGRHAMVGAGAVVVRDVPSEACVVGVPAKEWPR